MENKPRLRLIEGGAADIPPEVVQRRQEVLESLDELYTGLGANQQFRGLITDPSTKVVAIARPGRNKIDITVVFTEGSDKYDVIISRQPSGVWQLVEVTLVN